MFTRYVLAIAATILFAGAGNAEEENPDWDSTTLTGDWGGLRSDLSQRGVSLGFSHKSDVLANLSGGIARGTAWLGHTEASIDMDLEKLLGWDGTSAYIHYHSQLGSKFNANYVGSFMGVDNIETGTNTAQFYHAWLQKSFADDTLSVLAGLYPVDSEFYVTDTSGLFMQPPYGMANDMAQSGQNGPPVFPLGALAVRVKYTPPGGDYYVQGAVTDGVPGDPGNPQGTHVKLGSGDGMLSIMEFGHTPQEVESSSVGTEQMSFNKTAIGFWRYSTRFDDLVDVDAGSNPIQRPSQGVYFLAERTLMVEADHPAQGLSGFVRLGTASADVHQADWTASLGLQYQGLLAGRDDDIAGIAATLNHASSKYRLLAGADSNEVDFEATYRAQVEPWLAVQPVLQYILHPNMDPALENVWVAGVRMEVTF